MSSAVHNLQMAILDRNQSVTQLLRQTKLIAAKLSLEDVEKWVDVELKGYPDGAPIPDYRSYRTESLEMNNPEKGWQFVKHWQDTVLTVPEPISEIESLSKSDIIYRPLKEP